MSSPNWLGSTFLFMEKVLALQLVTKHIASRRKPRENSSFFIKHHKNLGFIKDRAKATRCLKSNKPYGNLAPLMAEWGAPPSSEGKGPRNQRLCYFFNVILIAMRSLVQRQAYKYNFYLTKAKTRFRSFLIGRVFDFVFFSPRATRIA